MGFLQSLMKYWLHLSRGLHSYEDPSEARGLWGINQLQKASNDRGYHGAGQQEASAVIQSKCREWTSPVDIACTMLVNTDTICGSQSVLFAIVI